jgi:hypothetical protein
MARRRSVGAGIRQFLSVTEIGRRNIAREALVVEKFGKEFNACPSDRAAVALYMAARSAASYGNLVLNDGKTVRAVFDELDKCFVCLGTGTVREYQEVATGAGYFADVECECKKMPVDGAPVCETCNDTFCVCSRRAA